MNKSSSTAAPKFPQKSAWAKGPPSNTSTAPSTRPQSPATQSPAQTHSRRSSQLGNVKDAANLGFAKNNAPPKNGPSLNFGTVNVNGTVNEKSSPPPPSPAAQAPPVTKAESRTVQSFGSVEATTKSTIQTSKSIVPTPSASASTSTSTTASSTPATTSSSSRPKMDVSALFRGTGNGDTMSQISPVTSTLTDNASTPPNRPNIVSPPNQNTPGPAGPGPQSHLPHTQPPYPTPFVPASHRNQNVGNNAPRSPSFQRQIPNNAAGRPPVANGPPGANANNMPSPRLSAPQHHPQTQQPHPQQPVQGLPQPQMQPMGWQGYYYPYVTPGIPMQGVPGQEHFMYQHQGWHMHAAQHQGPSGANGPPQSTPHAHTHGLPISSPRQPPPPLQAPGTPPAGMNVPLPGTGGRLNTSASAFVPGQAHQTPALRPNKNGTPSLPSTPAMGKRPGTTVRLETEEDRQKRVAREKAEKDKKEEEEKAQKAKEEEERRKREEKEEEERKAKEKQEREKAEAERKKKEEEEKERLRKEEEERRRKEEEEERKRKEEEMRKQKEEEERRRKEEEEERARKEEEEKEKLKKEEEERARKEEEERKIKEEERLRKEEEEKEKERAKAKEEEKLKSAPLEIRSRKEGSSPGITDVPLSTSPESHKKRPIPGPLDLSSTHKPVASPLPSALATARHIQDINTIQYPGDIKSPKPELNVNAKDGKFRYDRDFLLQFMSVCKEKPDNLPPLEAIGIEPSDQHLMGRGGSGRRGVSGGMGGPSRQGSVGLGIGAINGFGKQPSGFSGMGNFSAPGKLSSEERFMRSTSMGGGLGGMQFAAGRASPMTRSSSQGGAGGMGSKRTRSKRGDQTRSDSNRINATATAFPSAVPLEPVAPLEQSANRWVPVSTQKRSIQGETDSPEVVDRKVRSLLNKLTMEKFDSISNQIIDWANKSEREKDGRTLIQVIKLVFEKATDEAAWSEMYARLCRKMMEQISPNVQDDGIRNAEGKPITGGLLFRKYLLNRCQEDFERGWTQKESTAAAAAVKATEDQAIKESNEKAENKENGESALYSDEYYAAQKAKRQGLGLVKFIGELFKLQMLTERIMHECIKKLLSNVDNPEEEEIESLCKLLTTVGEDLDTSKARGHMDVYFTRMKELAKSSNVSSRMQFMLQDVIELRERKWMARNKVAAPTTIAQVHEAAAKEKAQQDNLVRTAMSRGGSRRGHDRDNGSQVGPDGWAVASGPSRPANKAGDLSNFGKIQKGGAITFGPTSVFNKRGDSTKRESASLSRASSNANMFQALQAESASELPQAAPATVRSSRPASRSASIDLTNAPVTEPSQPAQRPRLNLLPRSKPLAEKSEETPISAVGDDDREEGEIREKAGSAKSSLSKEQAEKKVDQDKKEFFAIRDLGEAEEYFSTLPSEHRHVLVEKFVLSALEAKEADAKLVADFFDRAISKNLCSPASFEDGFTAAAELLDDIAIDAPKAFQLMATMMKGTKLDEERRTRVASKSMDSDKLLSLLSA